MKKYISVLLALLIMIPVLCGCESTASSDNDKLSIVTTIFPEYDWVMQILGDNAENTDVTMLLDSGVDLHSYQPTADDIIKIATCDIFIYVGGESDEWVEDALEEAVNEDMTVIKLMDVLGNAVKEEELVEGMEAEASEEEEDETEYDEHIWLSLKNAMLCCNEIASAIAEKDSENADTYKFNVNSYTEKLNALDKAYQEAVDNSDVKTVLFADRFPFRYLADDYALSYYAAFAGCSAESEASFETVAFLADKLNEFKLPYVLTLEGSDNKIAETVIQTSGSDANILSMNSMQAVTWEDVQNGASYLDIMEKNLQVLTSALRG